MNVLSLFSGIGGIDLGLQRAGMTIAGQVEIDPWCRSILAKHWPEVPRHDDVRTAAAWWAGRRPVDVVAGGFPCQPVSQAGAKLAQADSRWLWPAFADVVRQLRPAYVLVENVPGLLVRGMGDVLGELAAIGYDAEWDCIPACFVGAPHIRNRVWIVAYPQRDAGTAWRPGDTGEGQGGRHAHRGRVSADVADAAHCDGVDVPGTRRALERQSRRGITRDSSLAQPDVADTERDRPQRPQRRVAGANPRGRRPASQGAAADVADPDIGGQQSIRVEEPAGQQSPQGRQPHRRSDIRDISHAPDPADTPGRRHQAPQRAVLAGRHSPVNSGWWVTEPDVGRVAHGIPRRVDRLRGLGNAVVPQVAEHLGRLIIAAAERAA